MSDTPSELDNLADDDFLSMLDELERSETVVEGAGEVITEDAQQAEAEGADEGYEAEDEGAEEATEEDDSSDGTEADTQDATDESSESTEEEVSMADRASEFYKNVTQPLKVNGEDFAVETAEEARQLMQMGVEARKREREMQPAMKVVQMLKDNNLMSEADLSFLIDVHKKNPAAITKLIKDAGIDPLDVDTEEAETYKPNDYSVPDEALAIRTVVDELNRSDTGKRTLGIIGSDWDEESRGILVKEPNAIRVLNNHVADGTFDKVMKVVERRRTFGQLTDIPDVLAYKLVGDELAGTVQSTTIAKPAASKPVVDKATVAAKRSASLANGKPTGRTSVDPDNLSDDEFLEYMKKNP